MTEAPSSSFVAQHTSTMEVWILDNLCRPALRLIPESVHPNALSLSNHLIAWTTFVLAIAAPFLDRRQAIPVLFFTGVGMFVTMLIDNLDGMHARRTGKCSKLGELLDHWLDAIHVPLVSAGLAICLQIEPWLLVGVHITNTMIYHSQLLLYHHRGEFIHPPASGTNAQLGAAIAYVLLGPFFYFFPRETPWVYSLIYATSIAAILVQLKQSLFYWVRLKRLTLHHLPFVLMLGAIGALYLLGAMDWLAFVLLITFVSFRISGSYVMFTIVKRPYSGIDLGVIFWIAMIGLVHFRVDPMALRGFEVRAAAPYAAIVWLGLRNLVDLARFFPEFRIADERRVRPA